MLILEKKLIYFERRSVKNFQRVPLCTYEMKPFMDAPSTMKKALGIDESPPCKEVNLIRMKHPKKSPPYTYKVKLSTDAPSMEEALDVDKPCMQGN